MPDHFTVKIQCKVYLKAWLENIGGSPVDLAEFPEISELLKDALNKKPENNMICSNAKTLVTAEIIIPDDWFYRYGWNIALKDVYEFNRKIERQLKFHMRMYIGLNASLGLSVATCIRNFQEVFNLPEPIWPYDSIKKDFDRHGKKAKSLNLNQFVHNFVSDNLSELGIVEKIVSDL